MTFPIWALLKQLILPCMEEHGGGTNVGLVLQIVEKSYS